jgi:hypothetical protein
MGEDDRDHRRRVASALAAFTRIISSNGPLSADCDGEIQLCNGLAERALGQLGKSSNSGMPRIYLSHAITKFANTSASRLIKQTAISNGLRIPASRFPTKRPENKSAYTDNAPLLSDQSVGWE